MSLLTDSKILFTTTNQHSTPLSLVWNIIPWSLTSSGFIAHFLVMVLLSVNPVFSESVS
ncbi:hypothetical protein BDV33DRAFT_186220 [Aspergillus novoparasiticus]|uniref:Uncharacterized protein n=1 Tax=Aspergillus novoparasiticus TaxID=986946 RepID=A0A5N6E677_9EURO|nr:hypothetical protein BDV33DRAFT_186220 [Aspergillus novoparasiticus]